MVCAGQESDGRELIEAGPALEQEDAPFYDPGQRKHDASAARADSPAHLDRFSSATAVLVRHAPLESVCSAFVPFAGVSTNPSGSVRSWRRGVWVRQAAFRPRGEPQFRTS